MVIERSTYKNHVINYIYNGIRENRFLPGEKILESHLSKDLGISRAPVREALADLVSAGVLDYRPQVGNFIASPTPEEIIESYVTRGVLEGFAVAQGRESFHDQELNSLETMAHQMEVYARKRQHKNLIDLGQSFHEMLFRHCQNRQVVKLTEQLSLKLHLFFYKYWAEVYTAEEIRDRHLQIVEALRGKDPLQIELLIRSHYVDTGHKIAEIAQTFSRNF